MKILCYDIETYVEMFLVVVLIPGEHIRKWEVSRWKNELDSFAKFCDEHKDYYWVGYNSLRFDSQVVEWVLRNYGKWYDLTGLEIAEKISQKGQDVIDDANYDIFPQYKEEQLYLKQIDLFTIWHFNNKNRRVSLKSLEYAMDLVDVEEMPIHFSQEDLTRAQAVQVIKYCYNDVKATYAFYLVTRGETDLELYRGEDKIADRLVMKDEFGLDCLNWDNVKIGAEWNKLDYIALTKRAEETLKPDKIIHFYGKRFRQFFPPVYRETKPQTQELRKFLYSFGNSFVLNKKQEFRFRFPNGLVATIAKGGIHSNEKARLIKPKSNEIYYQCDIGSQYPNAIRKYGVEPRHLPGWNDLIVDKIDRRLSHKKLAKETNDPKYNSMQKMGKDALNGGSYGRLNTKGDWQEYPYGMLQVTIGGQIELLLITEDLVKKGFNVVSLNTDGFDCVINEARDKEFKEILTSWEKLIGNDTLGQFEYTKFQWIAQTSVNHYIALKEDGKTKEKGDFEIDKEIHKNKSMRVVRIALKEYFVNGVPVEDTIRSHKNIYDFTLRQKATNNFHYEGILVQNGNKTIYNKLIRYYVAKKGEKLLKIKNPWCTTNAAKVSQVHAGEWLCEVCNHLPANTSTDNVDFSFYINKASEIIGKIEYSGRKRVKKDINQLSLF